MGTRATATRERILDAAGRLFRRDGVDATGVDAVMREAGLTHGGFYAHFASKDALAAEAAQALLQAAADRWEDAGRGGDPAAALAEIVLPYLDAERIAAGRCCPLPALGGEVARRGSARKAVAREVDRMIDALARCLPGQRRDRAMAALSTMVGAVVLARLADDPATGRAVLAAAADSVLGAARGDRAAGP